MSEMPLPDASVDVVISNCVINLSADEPAVLREAARVLRPAAAIVRARRPSAVQVSQPASSSSASGLT